MYSDTASIAQIDDIDLFTMPDTQDELDIFSIPDTPVNGFYMHILPLLLRLRSLGASYHFQKALRFTWIELIFHPRQSQTPSRSNIGTHVLFAPAGFI